MRPQERGGDRGGEQEIKVYHEHFQQLKVSPCFTLTSSSDNAEYIALIIDIHRVVHQV